jgi:uncharacterized protein (UPF0335 family)
MSRRQLVTKVKQTGEITKEGRKEINKNFRILNRQLKEVSVSRDSWKSGYKELEQKVERLEREKNHCLSKADVGSTERIVGHKFDAKIVRLCIALYTYCGCSFRGVVDVLEYMQQEYGLFKGDIPTKSSIENWVQKLGYYEYTEEGGNFLGEDYNLIIDESMVVGQERMMVVLGQPSTKEGESASKLEDVKVLALSVKPSWNGDSIKELLEKVQEKMGGKKPQYVISDGASTIVKGIRDADMLRICDIGHELGKYIEQTYKDKDNFKSFTKVVGNLKFKEIMKPTAYLLPPQQRSVARFMNYCGIIKWASKILHVLPSLSEEEKRVFGCIKEHEGLVIELTAVYEMVHDMLKKVKNEGLSHSNIGYCITKSKEYTKQVPKELMAKLVKYFKTEKEKLPNAKSKWNSSSDVLESLFGKYKSRASPNKLNGVTPLMLSLCVHTHFHLQSSLNNSVVKCALESILMRTLKGFSEENLIENQVVRRIKTFKK